MKAHPLNLIGWQDDDLDIKVCDFGLARRMSPAVGGAFAPFRGEADHKPGKIAYMAPEIFAGLDFSGEACDVYSMGVILFVMLTGVPPYNLPNPSDERFRMVYGGQMTELLRRWGFLEFLDPDAVDLMSRMLCPADQRLSLPGIFQHPWLTQPNY